MRDRTTPNAGQGTTLLRCAPVGAACLAIGLWLPLSAQGAKADVPGLDAGMSASPPYTCTTNYYVDAVNGNDSNTGTQAKPFATIMRANFASPVPKAGTCVNVLPGTYTVTQSIQITNGGSLNTPAGFVVYRSTVPHAAHIIAADANVGNIVNVETAYVIIDGFNVDGNHSVTSGNGLMGCLGGYITHHFTAINNIVHDMGGAGLATCNADYITWEHNVVYNTSSTSWYQVSGIDVTAPKALAAGSYTRTAADNVTYGIVVAYNRVYNNSEGPGITVPHTDGNGIIIDSSNISPAYPGNMLVLGNVSYNNGGGGIHVFVSSNVTVANNTVYHNYQDLLNTGEPRGELSNGASQNVNWINNIAVAVPGPGVLSGAEPMVSFGLPGSTDTGTWTNNIGYGAGVSSDSTSYINPATNKLGVNPMLTNPAAGVFALLPGSPAIKTGIPETYIPSKTPDIGAY